MSNDIFKRIKRDLLTKRNYEKCQKNKKSVSNVASQEDLSKNVAPSIDTELSTDSGPTSDNSSQAKNMVPPPGLNRLPNIEQRATTNYLMNDNNHQNINAISSQKEFHYQQYIQKVNTLQKPAQSYNHIMSNKNSYYPNKPKYNPQSAPFSPVEYNNGNDNLLGLKKTNCDDTLYDIFRPNYNLFTTQQNWSQIYKNQCYGKLFSDWGECE